MPAAIEEFRSAAEVAARRGGEILRRRFEESRTIDLKGQIDLVTDADHAAERVILEFVQAEFPEHGIVAEETGQVAPMAASAGPCWYIDPLDGTTNYAHRVPHFCVSVALWDAQGPLAGAVYQPLLDDLYSAGRGAGASCNGEPLRVSSQAGLAQALIATGFPYDIWAKPEAPLKLFTAVLGQARGVRRFGAAALDLAYVACGRFDGYFELGLYPWDVAAGILLVQEAGGLVSNLRGKPSQVGDRQIIAANPAVHRELVSLLAPLAP